MINVELSNIWGCVSLPELLHRERDIFDAHLLLRDNQPDGPCFRAWLDQPDAVTARTVHAIHAAADRIAACADTLVVIGSTSACRAAEAGIRLLAGQKESRMRVIFAGRSLSAGKHLELCEQLQSCEYCLLLLYETDWIVENCIAARSVRRMMERRYGMQARQRIFVCAPEDSPMAAMATSDGCTFFPMPPESVRSALSSAALLPMAVCAIDPIGILEGAREGFEQYDLRAFENPVWMYAGARCVLAQSGRRTELMAATEPDLDGFGRWWQQHALQSAAQIQPVWCPLPQELERMQALLDGRLDGFATLLRLPSMCPQTVGVEMDWKDHDGFGYLDGKSMQDVSEAFSLALSQAHELSGAPQIVLECGEMNEAAFGELLYFFELSNAICANVEAAAPSAADPVRSLLPPLLGAETE